LGNVRFHGGKNELYPEISSKFRTMEQDVSKDDGIVSLLLCKFLLGGSEATKDRIRVEMFVRL